MRDTIEHELYMRNYVSEGVEQLEFSFDNAVESYGAQVRKQLVLYCTLFIITSAIRLNIYFLPPIHGIKVQHSQL